MPRNLLITSALPYANGSIHIGHLVEYIQTDIFVRFQKLRGHLVTYVCGDDSHGTPIMLKAQQEGSTPEAYIARFHKEHKADFATFGVGFDNYYTTHSDINRDLSYIIYDRVKAAGIIAVKEIEQLFDPQANIFLPDRFIKGTCPFCKTPDQYGDSCENCDKTFDPADLLNPVSVVSGATPILKKSRHLFLQLESSRDLLLKLYEAGLVDDAVKNKLLDWFKEPLRDWDISRDAPFFGFPIPNEEEGGGKFFYNWFDAPIGYLASLGNLLKENAADTLTYWNRPDHEIIHFIGKDIQYFHALFWPVMLAKAGLRTPTKIAIHGHLTVNGRKMSKRDGTFIKASTFARHLDPQWLRYYYATKLGPTPEDLDLSLEDFVNRVNSELVGKLANLISRAAPMVTRLLDSRLGVPAADALGLLNEIRAAADPIAEAYEGRNFALATRQICALADKANKYFDEQAPWKLVKTDPEAARGVLTATLEAGRILTIYLKPVLPEFAAKVEKCLQIPPLEWKHIQDSMPAEKIGQFEHLVARIEMKAVQAMIEESKETQSAKPATQTSVPAGAPPAASAASPATPTQSSVLSPQSSTPPGMHPAEEPLAPTCNIDQFIAIDLRVAQVLTAEPVEKSDKLMKLTIDLGHLGQRTILAGIKNAYTPDRLVGRLVIVCANLAARKMGKFGTSEGMVLASGPGGAEIYVLTPDSGAKPGQRVH